MTIGLPNPKTVSKTAVADLSLLQYHAVKLDTAGKVTAITASTDLVYGIIQNTPVTDEAAEIAPINGGGSSFVYLSGTLASAVLVAPTASGTAMADTTGQYNMGQLEFGGAATEYGVLRLGNLTIKA